MCGSGSGTQEDKECIPTLQYKVLSHRRYTSIHLCLLMTLLLNRIGVTVEIRTVSCQCPLHSFLPLSRYLAFLEIPASL